MNDNPLLESSDASSGRPAFGRIRSEHVVSAVGAALARHALAIEIILYSEPKTFASVFLAKELADAKFTQVWSVVTHLKMVIDSPELRMAHDAVQPKVLGYLADLNQNPALFAALEQTLADDLCPVERRAVELAMRDLRLAGVALGESERRRFAEISVELGALTSAFGDAVLDATNHWTLPIDDEGELAGLPDAERATLAAARHCGGDGWLVSLHAPSVRAIMTFAEQGRLRAEVYRAFQTRASEEGPDAGRFDNSDRMRRILALRREAANLLGFRDAVETSLISKMAPSGEAALAFLRDLARQARPFAETEIADAREFARAELGIDPLEPWDLGFVSEKMRQALHALDDAEIKNYLPIDKVTAGLTTLLKEVFGIDLIETPGVDAWHPDVRYYTLSRPGEAPFAGVYFDLYARAGKQGGAWMDVCRARIDIPGHRQRPIAYLVCNFSPPANGVSLLTHHEVLTLLHEMGHCLHHLLGEVPLPSIGGISGFEWDAVELPSQLMENFGWDPGVLSAMSGHVETGEPIPTALINRMLGARGFQAGMSMLRQIEASIFDIELHATGVSNSNVVMETLARVREETSVNTPPGWTRFPHAFTHIFAGGYAAGYYSYLWAERLSADAFEKFQEVGYAEAGEAFRIEILSRGASRSAEDSYQAFRGQEPSNAALLRSRGLTAA